MDNKAKDSDSEGAKGADPSIAMLESGHENASIADESAIQASIYTVRGVQVMLADDLAPLYGVDVKYLHRQVRRNAERFPGEFAMHLPPGDVQALRCQNVTSKHGGNRYGLLAFTEQGVAMLSGILKSERAVAANIAIMRAFVAMHKALASVAPILTRLEAAERRQIADQARNEERFDTIFRAMDGGEFPPQKVFFEGKHYDAWSFARKLVRRAAESIVLVDGYCDDTTLDILSQKRGGADVTVATSQKSASRFLTPTAIDKFNKQNPTLIIRTTGVFHDRFLILDGKELYHFGASLKDLGRLYCAVSKMDAVFIPSIMARI